MSSSISVGCVGSRVVTRAPVARSFPDRHPATFEHFWSCCTTRLPATGQRGVLWAACAVSCYSELIDLARGSQYFTDYPTIDRSQQVAIRGFIECNRLRISSGHALLAGYAYAPCTQMPCLPPCTTLLVSVSLSLN